MVNRVYDLLVKVCCICSFVPWINLKNSKLAVQLLSRIYPGIISSSIFVVHCYQIQTEFFQTIVEIPSNLLILSTVLVCIHSAYCKRKYWRKWFRLYDITNKKFKITFNESLELGWTSVFVLLGYVLFMMTTRALILSSNSRTDDYYTLDLTLYIKLFIENLLLNFSMTLLKGFKMLNKRTKSMTSNKIIQVISVRDDTRAKIYRRQFKNLFEMSVCFNEIFCWLFTASLGHSLVTACTFSQYLIRLIINQRLQLSYGFWMVFLFRLVSKMQE